MRNMKYILFSVILLLNSVFVFPNGETDSIKKIVLYPPLVCVDSVIVSYPDIGLYAETDTIVLPSLNRCNFSEEYKPLRLRYSVIDADLIMNVANMLSNLDYIKDLGYSNTEMPAIFEFNHDGHPSYRLLSPPLLGQILIIKENDSKVIWLTTAGLEIDGKLYAYSDELSMYFREIIHRRIHNKEIEW